MLIQRLRVASLRRLADVDLHPAPGINLIHGENGSGKTSLLEAMHLMAHGRSFRGRVRDGLIRSGDPALEVFVEWHTNGGPVRRAGLRHAGGSWEARLDGQPVAQLGELCQALAVVTFEPGSHALVDGGAEVRRRYVDWGLFHVEPGFLGTWRRYARALKQRNSLLRSGRTHSELEAWEHELSHAGEALHRDRETYVAQLAPVFQATLARLLPAAGEAVLSLQPGWRRQELSLADALILARDRDLAQGHTSVGPHRASLRLELSGLPADSLSRGQAKLAALGLLLAQATHLAALAGAWPVLQLDDLGSELDRRHQRLLVEWLASTGAQVFITGTEIPVALADLGLPATVFHVEHGMFVQANP